MIKQVPMGFAEPVATSWYFGLVFETFGFENKFGNFLRKEVKK